MTPLAYRDCCYNAYCLSFLLLHRSLPVKKKKKKSFMLISACRAHCYNASCLSFLLLQRSYLSKSLLQRLFKSPLRRSLPVVIVLLRHGHSFDAYCLSYSCCDAYDCHACFCCDTCAVLLWRSCMSCSLLWSYACHARFFCGVSLVDLVTAALMSCRCDGCAPMV